MTPQEKKKHSYEKDRRNVYGEHDKGSRKSIRTNKAKSRRRIRRHVKRIQIEDGDLKDNSEAKIKAAQKDAFVKSPDEPLGEVIEGRIEKRKKLVNRKAARNDPRKD